MPVYKFGNEIRKRTVVEGADGGGISLSFANCNYICTDGESEITGNINMALRTIENLGAPTNEKDAVTKEYVDNTKGTGFIEPERDGSFTAKSSLNFQGQHKIKNLPIPLEAYEASNKIYVDQNNERVKREIEENIPFEKNGGEYEYDAKGEIMKE